MCGMEWYKCRRCITHKCSNHNTIHLPHITMAILCKLHGEHILHHSHNARPIFTILVLKWRGPSPPMLTHIFNSLAIRFLLLLVSIFHICRVSSKLVVTLSLLYSIFLNEIDKINYI